MDVEYTERNADLSAALTAATPRRLDTRRIEHELRVLEDQLVHEQEYLQRTQYDTSSDVWLLKLAVDDVKRARENLVVRRMLWMAQHPDNAQR